MPSQNEINANNAYREAFKAIELIAASRNIDMRHLHHRYQPSTAVWLLRHTAASLLRSARLHDRATTRKVWKRHYPQATAR